LPSQLTRSGRLVQSMERSTGLWARFGKRTTTSSLSTPRVRCHQLGKVVRQLLFAQMVNLMIKALTDTADGAGIGLNG